MRVYGPEGGTGAGMTPIIWQTEADNPLKGSLLRTA